MAKASEYGLGPSTFPRGWFVVAEATELDTQPLPLHFFGQDFVLYRGQHRQPIILDAYCAHMGTHMACARSAMLVQNGEQIEGDNIRCPYHGWRYGADGKVNHIPYFDGPIPAASAIRSYPVQEVMGCIMMWFDPEGGDPDYAPPFLKEWDDPRWVRWSLDHLGELHIHPQEILDNMSDIRHLGPTHGAPCEYFENEYRDHLLIQRQGGFHKTYACLLNTVTWYTGPGVLLSKQQFGDVLTYEMIANTPVDDGVVKVWHGCLSLASRDIPSEEDLEVARQIQAGALQAFSSDFEIWKHKRPALKVMQLPTDGPFGKGRKWYSQFYERRDGAGAIQAAVNGVQHTRNVDHPTAELRELERGIFE